LYDAEGKALKVVVDTDPASATHGRVSFDGAATIYAALCAPDSGPRHYSLSIDADWTPILVNGYLPAPLETASFVDARGDILVDFPNVLPASGAVRSVDSITVSGTDNTASGKRLSVLYIGGEWPYGVVSDFVLTLTDPIIGIPRVITLPPVNLRKFYWVSPSGSGSSSIRGAPGSLSASVAAANAMPAELEPVIMMQGGGLAFDTGGMSVNRSMHLMGGWDGAPSGAVNVDPETRETVLSSAGPNAALILSGAGNASSLHGISIKPAAVVGSNAYTLDIQNDAAPTIWNCAIYARKNTYNNCQSVAIRCNAGTAPIFANNTINGPVIDGYAQVGASGSQASIYAVIIDGTSSPTFLNNLILSGRPNSGADQPGQLFAYGIYRSPFTGTGDITLIGNTFVLEDLPVGSNSRCCVRLANQAGQAIHPTIRNNLFIGTGDFPIWTESALFWTGDTRGDDSTQDNLFWGFNYSGSQQLFVHENTFLPIHASNRTDLDPGASAPSWITVAGSPALTQGMDPATYEAVVPVAARPFLLRDNTGAMRTDPFAFGAYE
jgi:hypothetical protein